MSKQLNDGYYLLTYGVPTRTIPVEISTAEDRDGKLWRYVRGADLNWPLHLLAEGGATFKRLVPLDPGDVLAAIQTCSAGVKYAFHRHTVDHLTMEDVIAAEKVQRWLDTIPRESQAPDGDAAEV